MQNLMLSLRKLVGLSLTLSCNLNKLTFTILSVVARRALFVWKPEKNKLNKVNWQAIIVQYLLHVVHTLISS